MDDVAAGLAPETLLELLGAVLNAASPLVAQITQTMDPQMISVFTVSVSERGAVALAHEY